MARIKPQALLIQSKKKKGPTRISLTTIITCNLIVILVVLSIYATYKHRYQRLLAVSEEECERGSKDHCSMFSNFPPVGAEGGSRKRKSNAKIRQKARLILPIELLTPACEARKSLRASIFDGDEAAGRQ